MAERFLRNCLFWVLLFSIEFGNIAFAQDIDAAIKKAKDLKNAPSAMLKAGVKVSGTVSANTTYYNAKLLYNRRIPFESIMSGSLVFDLFGKVKMPFNFSVNSQNVNFTHPFDQKYKFQQPFNRFQLKPTYKGLTLLIGTNSMTFSPLTLSGHRFKGLGIQFKPKKLPFFTNFMLGTLNPAVHFDTTLKTVNNRPSYYRAGIGFQIGYKRKQKNIELIFLHAKDNLGTNFIDRKKLDSLLIFPQQNLVLGIKGAMPLGKKFMLNAEFAHSALTQDLRSPQFNDIYAHKYFGIFTTNGSTVNRKAIKAGIIYKGSKMNVGLDYNLTDPDYRTLGAYYFANDFENISATVATQLLNNKLSVMAKLGRQRDNLNLAKSQSSKQWVGNMTLAYAPSKGFNAQFNYSNFTNFTNKRTDLEYLTMITPYNALDTLNFRQVNQNFSGAVMKIFDPENKVIKKALAINTMYQLANSIQGNTHQMNNIANLNLQYSHQNTNKNTSLGVSSMLTRNDMIIFQDWLLGPGINASKSFFDKALNTQIMFTFMNSFKSNKETSQIINARLGANYSIAKKHNFTLNLMFMKRVVQEIRPVDKDFWDFTANLTYLYSFSLLNLSKK